MTFVRSSIWLIVGCAVCLLSLNTYLTSRSLQTLLNEADQSQFAEMEAIVSSSVLSVGGRGLGRAEIIAHIPEVVKAFKERNRPRLLEIMEPIFKIQKAKYGMDRASFYLSPATMFLRVHSPKKFGEDVRLERQLITQANMRQENISGIEIGKAGVAAYSVTPIKEGNRHLGVFEVGLEFGPLLKNIKSTFGFDATLLIDQKPLRSKATLMDPSVLSPDNLIGDYANYYSTNWQLVSQALDARQLENIKESVKYTHKMNNATYGILITPLNDFSGKNIGRVVAVKDFQSSRSQSKNVMTTQVLACLFSIILQIGIVMVAIKGLMVRPLQDLTEKIADLAHGSDETVVIASEYVAELQPLVQLHADLKQAIAEEDEDEA